MLDIFLIFLKYKIKLNYNTLLYSVYMSDARIGDTGNSTKKFL